MDRLRGGDEDAYPNLRVKRAAVTNRSLQAGGEVWQHLPKAEREAMMNRDQALELLSELVEAHVASPDREELHRLLDYWATWSRAYEKLGLLKPSDMDDLFGPEGR